MVQKDTKPNNQSKYLSDSDPDNNKIDPRLKTSIEERQYNTIPGSTITTQITLSHSRAQANPTVERGSPQQKTKPKKSTSDNKKAETTGTSHRQIVTSRKLSFIFRKTSFLRCISHAIIVR